MRIRSFLWMLLTGSVVVCAQAAPAAQAAQRGLQQQQRLPSGELQRLLDGYAVIQGQEFLGLNEGQFTQFLPKFRALQEMRRKNEMERLRLIQELNRLVNVRGGQFSDTEVRDRLRALRDLETRSTGDLQKARDAIDQTLDLRQQARFRIFEEQLEQRKLQLLLQVRQANRANRPATRLPGDDDPAGALPPTGR